jgi:hypothetical protein
MSLRIFLDSAGREWQVLDVVPREDERRKADRRISGPVSANQIPVERRQADRRLTIGGRTHLHSGLAGGWLCFDCADERRRLSPIPENWTTATEEELADYCANAHPVRKSAAVNPRR